MTDESPIPNRSVAVLGEGDFARAVAGQVQVVAPAAADVVVIDSGDDRRNLEMAKARAGHAIVAIRDRALFRALDARRERTSIHYISPDDLVADNAFGPADLAEIAHWRGQSCVHVAILGFGPLAVAFFERIALDGIAGRFERPKISLIVEDERAASAWLGAEMPEIKSSIDVSISPLDLSLDDAAKSPLLACEAAAPLTSILIAAEDEEQTAKWFSAVTRLQEQTGRVTAALILAASAGRAMEICQPGRASRDLSISVSRVPRLEEIPDLVGLCLTRRDALARRLHGAYTRLYGAVSGSGPAWEDLAETYRRANRRAARHLATKLWTLGFSPAPHALAGGIESTAFETILKPLSGSAIEDDTMRRLARIEHDRWCADRRLDGWQYGQERDDGALHHPSLIPFDDPRLSAYEIGKDIAQIAFLLGEALHGSSEGLPRRVVVGVLGKAPAQSGISPDAAAAWLTANPQREPVVLSPLATAYEVAQVTRLIEGRADKTKLIVVTAGHDVQPCAAAKALLAREETVIAPISPPPPFSDGELLSAPRVEKHVAVRSDILVTP